MSEDEIAERQAVTRLFDLVRNGETDNCEFSQLDSLVYQRLLQAYVVAETPEPRIRTAAAA